MGCVECLTILQEEEEAQAKADKIKLALEKLKEAKVKKVNYGSLLHGEVKLMSFYYTCLLKIQCQVVLSK